MSKAPQAGFITLPSTILKSQLNDIFFLFIPAYIPYPRIPVGPDKWYVDPQIHRNLLVQRTVEVSASSEGELDIQLSESLLELIEQKSKDRLNDST